MSVFHFLNKLFQFFYRNFFFLDQSRNSAEVGVIEVFTDHTLESFGSEFILRDSRKIPVCIPESFVCQLSFFFQSSHNSR